MAYSLAPAAQIDLSRLWDYIIQNAKAEGYETLFDQFPSSFEFLGEFSDPSNLDDEALGNNIQSSANGDFMIFYRIQGKSAEIVRILDMQEDVPKTLQQFDQ